MITIIKDAFYVLRAWHSSHMRLLFSYRIKGERMVYLWKQLMHISFRTVVPLNCETKFHLCTHVLDRPIVKNNGREGVP
jgi:hypothetical protein